MLGLGNSLITSGKAGASIVTDNLVLKHGYALNPVQPLSDGAAVFDGVDDYITMGNVCNLGAADFSIAFWLNPGSDTTTQYYISKYQDGSNYWYIRLQGSSQTQFHSADADGAGVSRSGASTILANQWAHIVVTCDRSDSSGLSIYVNGVLDSSGSTSNTTDLDNTGDLKLGLHTTSNFADGYMCNVGIWDAVLTQPQIKSIMNKNYAGLSDSEKTSLVSWWNLDSVIDSADLSVGDTTVYDNHYGGGNELGSEIVADGGFDTDVAESTSGTYWITEAGWTISGGSATYDGGGDSNTQLETITNSSFTDSKVHKLTFDFTDTGGGGVYARVCGGGFSSKITGTGSKTVYLLAGTSTNRLTFETGDDNQAFSIDNVSVKLVNGNTGTLS